MLNTDSPIPLYYQLADILTKKIENDEYKAGTCIPSEIELAKKYNIGRPTVRQGTELLIKRGILERRRGSGTYVKEKQEEIDLFSLAGTSSAFQKKGIKIKTKLISNITKIVEEDDESPFKKQEVYFFSRVSLVEEEPVLFEEIYLDSNVFFELEKKNIEKISLSKIIESEYFMKPTGGKQNFTIILPDEKTAKILDIKTETPILLVKRFLNFKQSDNLVYTKIYCKTDQFVFSQELAQPPGQDNLVT